MFRVRQYKLAARDYLEREILSSKHCECKYCGKVGINKQELEKSGFSTTNKDVDWWRISEKWSKIEVILERDDC